MGTTKLARQQSFQFNQKEQVIAVYVKQGETVRPWQILAQLRTTSIDKQLNDARRAIEKEEQALARLLEGKDAHERQAVILEGEQLMQDLVRKQEDLTRLLAEADSQRREWATERRLKEEERRLDDQTRDLNRIMLTHELARLDRIYPTLSGTFALDTRTQWNAVRNAMRTYDDVFDRLDRSFGVTTESAYYLSFGERYEQSIYLGAKNQDLRRQAGRATEDFYRALTALSGMLATHPQTGDVDAAIYTQLQTIAQTLEQVGDLFSRASKESIVSSVLDQGTIDGLVALGASYRSQGQTDRQTWTKAMTDALGREPLDAVLAEAQRSKLTKEKELLTLTLAHEKALIDREKTRRGRETRERDLVRSHEDARRAVAQAQLALEAYQATREEKLAWFDDDARENAERSLQTARDAYDALVEQKKHIHWRQRLPV